MVFFGERIPTKVKVGAYKVSNLFAMLFASLRLYFLGLSFASVGGDSFSEMPGLD